MQFTLDGIMVSRIEQQQLYYDEHTNQLKPTLVKSRTYINKLTQRFRECPVDLHHCTVGKFGLSPYYFDILNILFSD